MASPRAVALAAVVAVCALVGCASSGVPVEFFVMSKCPDARMCGEVFGPALKELAPALDLRFSYIADSEKGGFSCMHGAGRRGRPPRGGVDAG